MRAQKATIAAATKRGASSLCGRKTSIWPAWVKKRFPKTVAKALLGKGRASIKGLVSKAGKKFDAVLVVEWAEPYPKFSLEFPQKKK